MIRVRRHRASLTLACLGLLCGRHGQADAPLDAQAAAQQGPQHGARADAAVALLSFDFQDGSTSGWTALGSADVRLSREQGNISLRLSAGAAAFTRFSATGFRQVVVTLAFAGQHLGATDGCVAELSADREHSWIDAARLYPGQDDGETLHRNGALLAPLTDAGQVILRLRNTATDPRAVCWADDIRVEATPMLSGEQAVASAATRRVLTASDLGIGASGAASPAAGAAAGPWPMSAFALPDDARAPRQVFEGHLQLLAQRPGAGFRVLLDRYGYAAAASNRAPDSDRAPALHLPAFDFEFIQSGDALIPLQRGAIESEDPQWEFILEPGKVWQESGDSDYSRASLPFALEERNANCMHNGVLTFLFRGDGALSDVAYEIGQETCSYFQFDAWGRVAARFVPGAVKDRQGVLARYADELAHRMPSRPIGTLAVDHPGADPNRFGSPAEVPAASMTLYGVMVDGVNYIGGCQTRFGSYPYCGQLDLPSYSLAKSLVGGLLSMRMALLYPGVMDARISDFVPECTPADGWQQVTFANVLDMASGHFQSSDFEVDEDAPQFRGFLDAEDHAGKLAFACRQYPLRARPGSVWVYHTSDTYLLGTALSAYYRRLQGPQADLFEQQWVEQLWAPLHLSPAVAVPRRTRGAVRQPFTGYGLTLQADDVAKLAAFINGGDGRLDGEQRLDRRLLDAALQRDAAQRGLATPVKDLRYQHGFWAWNAQSSLGCRDPVWIPFMSGFGGITVALMPNGIDYYYFSDGNVLSWARAAAEADRMRPFCRHPRSGGSR